MKIKVKKKLLTKEGGAWLLCYIPDFQQVDKYFTNDVADAWIDIDDGRKITATQRSFIYAIISDISKHVNGHVSKLLTAYYKTLYKKQLIDMDLVHECFSLSDCSITEANLLIDLLITTAFDYNIPLNYDTIKEFQDQEQWQWKCIKHNRCCICGKYAEVHHYDTIGMGNNRKTIDDSDKRKMALCRICHTKSHSMSREKFCTKNHVKPIYYEVKIELLK
jgi:hypothetical protein